jgi:hypothetical protein
MLVANYTSHSKAIRIILTTLYKLTYKNLNNKVYILYLHILELPSCFTQTDQLHEQLRPT